MARERRWIIGLGVALTLSLALNLLIAGLTISNRFDGHRPHFGGIGGRGFETMFAKLSPDAQEQLGTRFRALRPVRLEDLKAIRQARAAIVDIVTADPLDRSALEAQFDVIEERSAAMQKRLNEAFVDGVSALPLAERQRIDLPSRRRP